MKAVEVNFDGIVGPTHYYGGLSYGNRASMEHGMQISNPKQAALQGLRKMKFLYDLGIPQGILPPHERPFLSRLRALGFHGSDSIILQKTWKENPLLLMACSSASSMWGANAATVTPSCDSYDGKVHFTIANLQNRFHRSLEPEMTYQLFRHIFKNEALFTIHSPFPSGGSFGDEGAANHTRFCKAYGEKGVHLFVYGRHALQDDVISYLFPPRQCLEASEAVARCHGIPTNQIVFAQQNPEAIDAGVFHNDVISVGTQNIFLYHEKAFVDTGSIIKQLTQNLKKIGNVSLETICISEKELSLQQAVETYFFNSQIILLPNGKKILLAPLESESLSLQLPFPIYYFDVGQSMQNGGGPACLRIRVELTKEEMTEVALPFLFTNELYRLLTIWVEKYYRDRLTAADLADPLFLQESREALDALTQLLHMGAFYPFQKETCKQLL